MADQGKESGGSSFFTKQKAIWVSENFKRILLNVYSKQEGSTNRESANFSDLHQIQPETNLRELVFQNADKFLELLMTLIKNQLHKEGGLLLNVGSANLFRTPQE